MSNVIVIQTPNHAEYLRILEALSGELLGHTEAWLRGWEAAQPLRSAVADMDRAVAKYETVASNRDLPAIEVPSARVAAKVESLLWESGALAYMGNSGSRWFVFTSADEQLRDVALKGALAILAHDDQQTNFGMY